MNFTNLTMLATAEAEKTDIMSSLGIDWKLLILQMVAFLILVAILAKYVYPVFFKIISDREEKIEEGVKAAEEASKKAEASQADTEKLMQTARKEAAEIVALAKSEAVQMTEAADKKSKERAERIVADAHDQIQKDVLAAQKALQDETIGLVKKAASIATASVADDKLDAAMIKKSVQGAK